MSSSTGDAGEASSSRSALLTPGPIVRLPEDALAVEWWLARRAIDGAGPDDGGVPFAEDGVLALWPTRRYETDRWTFGLEFEFAVADASWVAHELHAIGLTASSDPVPYHTERASGLWSVEHDRSVTSVYSCDRGGSSVIVGGEVVSPPLTDTTDCWRQVAVVLDVLKRCGAEVNRSCGLHVHIGAEALRDPSSPPYAPDDSTLRATPESARPGWVTGGGGFAVRKDLLPTLSRLAMLTSVCFEDLVFRLASAEGGAHRGRAFFYRHCRPLERELRSTYERLEDLTDDLGLEGSTRRAALNLTNVGDPGKDTVEFRQCNGTLDGRVVQAFVRLCTALVGAARWTPDAVRVVPEALGTHYDGHRAPGSGESHRATDPTSLWRFLSAAFAEGLPAEAAASLLWLFRRGSWQPSLLALGSA
ncbi:MAG: amidoligase family protein [Chloroflexota bacterium]